MASTERSIGGRLGMAAAVPLMLVAAVLLIRGGGMVSASQEDVYAQNRKLGRGVNILGYDRIWRSRAEARMKDEHFRLIREAGFSSVRINLHPFRHMGAAPDYAIPPGWFETLDWAVEQALANDLMVILDLHEYGAMNSRLEQNKDRFFAAWRQLAPRYADAPSSVVFEILNEPANQLTPELWNRYLVEALAIIRASNPERTVIIGPGWFNSIDGLARLELPEDDQNIIVTVHFYEPARFTHQGADWDQETKDLSGIEWTGTPEEKDFIAGKFENAQRWAEEHDRPIFLGEFGAYDKADMASRARYTNFVARHAEQLGWSWAYWQFDDDFIVYDMDDDQWVDPIREALVPTE